MAILGDLICMGDRLALIVRPIQNLLSAGRPMTETVIRVGTREGSLHPYKCVPQDEVLGRFGMKR